MPADPSVLELQQLLVKHGYMTQAQLNTGPGILGERTRAAVSRLLDGKGPVSAGPPVNSQKPKPPKDQNQKPPKDAPHDTWFYIVQGVESLETLAREWGVSVSSLLNLSDNQSLKERQSKGKTLRAGDRIAVPPQVKSKLQKSAPKQDPSFVDSLVDYLLHLTDEHPASEGKKPQQRQPAKKVAKKTTTISGHAKPPSSTTHLPMQGYKKKHARIWSDVVLNKPIESAFLVLLPYLPKETVMTSGYRSDADQARIINEYYDRYKGNPLEKNVEKRRQWLKKEKKLIIAKVGSSPHRTGYAFDLSGGKLSAIEAAVTKCRKEQGDKFPLLTVIVERNQNCLHVNLNPAVAQRTS